MTTKTMKRFCYTGLIAFVIIVFAIVFSSCSTPKQLVHYKAYTCNCQGEDNFAFDVNRTVTDSGTTRINPRFIERTTSRLLFVNTGRCKYVYQLK